MIKNNVFECFPKKRTVLPLEYQKIYEKHYSDNRNGQTKMSSLSQKMESWLHKCIAKSSAPDKRTLEIGAGTLNQLKYEKPAVYDIIEPFKPLYKQSPELDRINKVYNDISDICEEHKYERIISCASFEHIINLPEVVARSCLLLSDNPKNACLYVSIPNEGRFLWKLGYKLSTGLEFKKNYNLKYEVIMNHEHVNTADEIENILKYFYKKIKIKLLGINKTFSLYRFYECKEPCSRKAKEYLSI